MNCQITDKVFDVLRSLQDAEKKPKDYGTGQPLYHAEVSFLEAIHRQPEANVSQLAASQGITKGAVTQLTARLCDKGLIEPYRLDGNKKEKYVRLTDLGRQARSGHEQYHREANDALCAYFCSLTEEETGIILGFLDHLYACVPFCQFPCKGHRPREERK